MRQWLEMELTDHEREVVIGTPGNALVRPGTKNLIEAPEKSYKTTFLLRQMAGSACGQTVFPELPVVRPRKTLYLHGELSDAEIQERTRDASVGLTGDFENFLQGRVTEAHLIEESGRKVLRSIIEDHHPEDVVLDPWQSFIAGYDENSYKDMSRATAFCNDLISEFGVTLFIPIHLGKDRSRGARGHSSIQGWRDTRIQLSKDGNGVSVEVEPRWAAPPAPFRLRFNSGTLWSAGNCGFTGQTAEIRGIIKEAGGKIPLVELGKRLGKDGDALRKAVSRACDAGAIDKDTEYAWLPLAAGSEGETVN